MSKMHAGREITPAPESIKDLDEDKLMAAMIMGYQIINGDTPKAMIRNFAIVVLALLAHEAKERGINEFYCDSTGFHRSH